MTALSGTNPKWGSISPLYFYSESIFKLLHVFGGILGRRMIAGELSEKLPKLLDILDRELSVIEEIIKTQQRKVQNFETPIIDRNMPKVSGQISFAKELSKKIERNINSFKNIEHSIIESQEAAQIIEKANSLTNTLNEFEDNTFITWAKAAEKNTSKVKEKILNILFVHNSTPLRVLIDLFWKEIRQIKH